MENKNIKYINLILIREDIRKWIVNSCDFESYEKRKKKEYLDSDFNSFLCYVSYNKNNDEVTACIKLENWMFNNWQIGGFYKYEIKNDRLKKEILNSIR